jgi:hypothetical protein
MLTFSAFQIVHRRRLATVAGLQSVQVSQAGLPVSRRRSERSTPHYYGGGVELLHDVEYVDIDAARSVPHSAGPRRPPAGAPATVTAAAGPAAETSTPLLRSPAPAHADRVSFSAIPALVLHDVEYVDIDIHVYCQCHSTSILVFRDVSVSICGTRMPGALAAPPARSCVLRAVRVRRSPDCVLYAAARIQSGAARTVCCTLYATADPRDRVRRSTASEPPAAAVDSRSESNIDPTHECVEYSVWNI